MQKVVFFFPFFTHSFILALDCTSSGSPAQARIAYAPAKTCCIFKTNDHIFLYKLAGKLKNSLRLSKVDFKTFLVCYNAVTPTKWQNTNATPNWTRSDLFRRHFSKNYQEGPLYETLHDLRHKAIKMEWILEQIVTWKKRLVLTKSHSRHSFPFQLA